MSTCFKSAGARRGSMPLTAFSCSPPAAKTTAVRPGGEAAASVDDDAFAGALEIDQGGGTQEFTPGQFEGSRNACGGKPGIPAQNPPGIHD